MGSVPALLPQDGIDHRQGPFRGGGKSLNGEGRSG